jgi:molybdenum cofactor synthesis domain-containing protein
VAVLVISDGVSAGTRQDTSGELIAEWARGRGDSVAALEVVPDESLHIAATIARWCDQSVAELVITTGGTGLGPRDVTPEATRAVLEREAPGIAEAIRAKGREQVPTAALGRGLAGNRGRTLIVNLPGSTGGVSDGLAVLDSLVDHAVRLLAGQTEH